MFLPLTLVFLPHSFLNHSIYEYTREIPRENKTKLLDFLFGYRTSTIWWFPSQVFSDLKRLIVSGFPDKKKNIPETLTKTTTNKCKTFVWISTLVTGSRIKVHFLNKKKPSFHTEWCTNFLFPVKKLCCVCFTTQSDRDVLSEEVFSIQQLGGITELT